MAAPINSIAATFSALNTTASPPISLTRASWNPHSSLTRSHKSYLLDLYGSPAPLPHRLISTDHSRRIQPLLSFHRTSTISATPANLPSCVHLSYLDKNGVVRSASLGGLCKGKRRVAVVGISAAFSPGCARFLKRVESAVSFRAADLIACVAANDAFVMAAWGESMAVDWSKWKMLSDGGGEIWKELGISRDGGGSMRRFWLSVYNGIVTHVSLDEDGAKSEGDDGDRGKLDSGV